jgi:flagellar biosynthesis chaperone FliJ
MATYTSEEEIDAARERSLSLPMQATKAIESKLDKVNQQLTALKKQADVLATQKKKLPAHLLEDVNVTQMQVSGLEAELAQRKAQSDAVRARFEADKQRFRELKNPGSQ